MIAWQIPQEPGHILSRVYNCTGSKKFPTLPFWKKTFSSDKISDDFFSHSLRISIKVNFNLPKFLTTFYFSPMPVSQLQVQKYNCTPKFLMNFFRHSLKMFRFSPLFSTYKVTTTTAQFTFYNCKWHLTTAEIVISYTLKYALTGAYQDCIHNVLWRKQCFINNDNNYQTWNMLLLALIYYQTLNYCKHSSFL